MAALEPPSAARHGGRPDCVGAVVQHSEDAGGVETTGAAAGETAADRGRAEGQKSVVVRVRVGVDRRLSYYCKIEMVTETETETEIEIEIEID